MTFTPEQIEQLSGPLNKIYVKIRKQGGRDLSYIEGWHAITEANRIFGFGEWSRETIELKCVSENQRKVGSAGADGFGVTYIAKVRITIGGTTRDGCGAGHGIDRDLGLAHESAMKEAETDAMKRALMTFGNPFGLALYDKSQANVVSGNGNQEPEWGSRDGVTVSRLLFKIIKETVLQQSDVIAFREQNKGMIASLPAKMQAELNAELDRIGAANPVSEETRAAFVEELKTTALEFENANSLREWWQSEDLKQRMRDFELTADQYKQVQVTVFAHGKMLAALSSIKTGKDAA